MKDPKVIVPEGFDVRAAWKGCRDWVNKHEAGSFAAAAGADPGCVDCPACREDYWAWGQVIECECSFIFPTNWWGEYSSGVSDGRRLKAGGSKTPFVDLRCRNPYYRHGLENPVDEPWDERRKIDWKKVCEGSSVNDYAIIRETTICGRCGREKELERSNSPTKLCIQCSTETLCKHRTSMLEPCCKAGVNYKSLGKNRDSIGHSLPCYFISCTTRIECPKFEPVTVEDCIESDQKIHRAIERLMLAGPIVKRIKEEHHKHDWSGEEPCPVCGKTLSLSHSGYNGHVHGRCETEGCLSWME